MALTTEELQQIDENASTKDDLKEALAEYESEHPDLEEVDPDNQTRDEMLEVAEEAIDDELTAEGKRRALKELAEEQPDTVLHLAGQAFLRIEHPQTEETVTMSVFSNDDMGWTTTQESPFLNDQDLEDWEEPEPDDPTEKPDVGQVDVQVFPLSDIPEWALPKTYDLIMIGTLEVFESPADAQRAADRQVKGDQQAMLDEPSQPVRMEQYRDEQSAGVGQTAPVISEPSAEFKRPEQRAAWRVVAKTVDGEDPLPENPDEISADPKDITDAEKARVERRIRRCLEAPQRFDENAEPGAFDKRAFFDQLLQLEMDGTTAPRNREQKISGVTRPQIIKLIRAIADESGFEAVGTYVQERPDTGFDEDLPGTVPVTPEGDRKHDPYDTPGIGEADDDLGRSY